MRIAIPPFAVIPLSVVSTLALLGGSPFSPASQQAPELTEVWQPVPVSVQASDFATPPSDAVLLLDGQDLSRWQHGNGNEASWAMDAGTLTVVPGTGDLATKRGFGDVQLHIEWRTPPDAEGVGQEPGNSGVFLMSRYEVQILESHANRTYSNGQAGAIYKQFIPAVNASKPKGEWQSYDIIFNAPRFAPDGSVETPAVMTVFHNGVLIHDHVRLRGTTTYIGEPEYEHHRDREPLLLQDHGNRVSFRNIWLRELPRTSP